MSTDEGVFAGVVTRLSAGNVRRRGTLATGAIWLIGAAIVAAAQPGSARKEAALGTAVAAIGMILVVVWRTQDHDRRYFRSLLGGTVAVSLTSTELLRWRLGTDTDFRIAGLETRIALPLMFVLFLPLVAAALPEEVRNPQAIWRLRKQARPMDWIAAAYVALIVPGLAVGFAYHSPKTDIAQDLGLVVFLVFMYIAGRLVPAETARASAQEFIGVLLVLAVASNMLTHWVPIPLFSYVEAAAAAAVAYWLLQPRRSSLLALGVAVTILVADVVTIHTGSGSTVAVDLAGAMAVIAYLVVRIRPTIPLWLIAAVVVLALVVFVGFTSDGRTLRGQYYGADPSNAGRTYEAQQVRNAVRHSPVSIVFGRGFGATINETGASTVFQNTLYLAGRDLAHVQEVHLLDYDILLKLGFLGLIWLAALIVGVVALVYRALEWAARRRDPAPVIYAALPLLGLVGALAAATHLQSDPFNGFALGVLVTLLGARTVASEPSESPGPS
ncbi:MAG TPA: O-antigen ligase family protein [Gaiellaceae bacterium]|nr:O-antigen ligase family protein [Gaiellaceae bacterium]